MRERFWNVPNVLSLYRLAASPVIGWVLLLGNARLYITLLFVSLVTDIADGWIARRFNLGTQIGARLDSLADLLTFSLAICGIFRFKWGIVAQPAHAASIGVFLLLYTVLMLTGFLKFGRQPSLHTYGFKIAAYVQGICLIWSFLQPFNDVLFYLAVGCGILACIEEIAILMVLTEPRSDVRGLYWVLKARDTPS